MQYIANDNDDDERKEYKDESKQSNAGYILCLHIIFVYNYVL